MAISAKELAAIVGVSPATISMVYNNKPGISAATKELVLKAAEEYGYVNKKAEKAKAASVIQFVTYKKHEQIVADTPFFSALTEGISQECAQQNCVLHMSYVHENDAIAEQIEALKKVDCIGILLLATEMSPENFALFSDISVPMVVLDCYYDDLDYDCVLINNTQGAYAATRHLIAAGHRSIGYLHSSVDCGNFSERGDGFYKALRSAGLSVSDAPLHLLSPTSQGGYQDMVAALAQKPRLATAYFADNDIIAAAAMKALLEAGYRIPEDVSIIGFDDMPLCDMMTPALSSMHVQKKELGAVAIRQLLRRIKNPVQASSKVSFGTTLVQRDSVKTF